MKIAEEIIKVMGEKGIPMSEEKERMISRIDLVSELMGKGYDKEDIEAGVAQLCSDGTLAMDEQSIYQYDFPGGLVS